MHVWCVLARPSEACSEDSLDTPTESPSADRPGNLITHVTATDGQPLTVTVIDSEARRLAVYHVDRQTGEITLKSVRNITWDLQMIDFNTANHCRKIVRSGLQK